ncbi:MAG TPA: riboflavin biosynthesis protein RibF, partial [Candidatus Udaeobacter sp.]|nr:riboflavin biosynthesis protein RibF [Candidatus Udaeobacter sp.]
MTATPVPPKRPLAAATIGVFDGVHRGHQALLARVVAAARRLGGQSVVVTFNRHPLAVLAPERCPPAVVGPEERAALLESYGIDAVIALEFDGAVAGLSAREFLEQVLGTRYELRVLVIGPDFAMGRGRAGDARALSELGQTMGFAVEVVSPVTGDAGERISSTQLRNAIRAGDLAAAREQLGRDLEIRGRVVSGAGRGRGLGAPTANLAVDPTRLLPADGVYAALVRVEAPGRAPVGERPAVVNIGLAPTFGDGERRVEVHLLDLDQDLHESVLTVRLLARLRDEQRFPDAVALRTQIAADIA